jgi:hypothetical protein
MYRQLTYDMETMRNAWAELVGFRSPDMVGSIAPEIKPGTYTWRDREHYPGLQELMPPALYARFQPGAPPLCGNFPELEVVPTRQYYLSLPVCRASRRTMGQAQLNAEGYLIESTYQAGVPFPQPSGTWKAQQIVYNWVKRYMYAENLYAIQQAKGYTDNLKEDMATKGAVWRLQLQGRLAISPLGWYDRQAEERGETMSFSYYYFSPRDMFGSVMNTTKYRGWNDYDQYLLYIAQIRRIRKISGTDTQDISAGMDLIPDDAEIWSQKITPFRNPYTYSIIAEREFLMPAYSRDGSEYFSAQGLEVHNITFERRPCYVITLTQQDPSYIYRYRVLYVDRETFVILFMENYDRGGRLYRTTTGTYGWVPEAGLYTGITAVMHDHVDQHSTFSITYCHPAPWITRKHINILQLIRAGK